MQIKELSRHTGVDVQTIRYYEKQALLPPPARRSNGYRDYGHTHLERLAFIRHCRLLDMPLADVRQLLAFLDAPQSNCQAVEELIEQQLTRVRTRAASLQALENQLLQLRTRCQGGQPATEGGLHCGILNELVAAAHGEACACNPHHCADT